MIHQQELSIPMSQVVTEAEAKIVVDVLNSFRSVSYTHLDVYKRQLINKLATLQLTFKKKWYDFGIIVLFSISTLFEMDSHIYDVEYVKPWMYFISIIKQMFCAKWWQYHIM